MAIPVDGQGRMMPVALRGALGEHEGPAIVCAQAGNVNTGACDPMVQSPISLKRRARGCMLTAHLVCGPRQVLRCGTWSPASSAPTRGLLMRINGSMSPTTQGSRSARTRRPTKPR